MKLNIGITQSNVKHVIYILNQILSDEFVLYAKTLNYHWNIKGNLFGPLHKLFETQYEMLLDIVDDVAERTRSLGGRAFGSLEEFLEHTSLKETKNVPHQQTMIKNLLTDHETIIRNLRQAIDITLEEYEDVGTNNFLTDLLEKHEKTAWMLRAHLEK